MEKRTSLEAVPQYFYTQVSECWFDGRGRVRKINLSKNGGRMGSVGGRSNISRPVT